SKARRLLSRQPDLCSQRSESPRLRAACAVLVRRGPPSGRMAKAGKVARGAVFPCRGRVGGGIRRPSRAELRRATRDGLGEAGGPRPGLRSGKAGQKTPAGGGVGPGAPAPRVARG